jgi:hypothetical protein
MIGNEEDFTASLGFEVKGVDHNISVDIETEAFKDDDRDEAVKQFPNFKVAATTLRRVITATQERLERHPAGTTVRFHDSRKYPELEILDRVGGGDSFALRPASSASSNNNDAAEGRGLRRGPRRVRLDHPRRHLDGRRRKEVEKLMLRRRRPGRPLSLPRPYSILRTPYRSPMSSLDLFSLKGRVAVVIGGAGELCGAMAEGFASAGAHVILVGRDPAKADARLAKIKSAGGSGEFLSCEATNKADLVELRDGILAKHGKVDVLAERRRRQLAHALLRHRRSPGLDKILTVNVKGVVFGCQVFGEAMVKAGSGSIINLGSESGILPLSRVFTYFGLQGRGA